MNPETRALADGTRVMFRPVEAGDKDLLQAGFDALTRETRYRRFSMPKPRLTAAELVFYTEMDGVDHFAVAVGRIDAHLQHFDQHATPVGNVIDRGACDLSQMDTARRAGLNCYRFHRHLHFVERRGCMFRN